jgi:hypothetical protein
MRGIFMTLQGSRRFVPWVFNYILYKKSIKAYQPINIVPTSSHGASS